MEKTYTKKEVMEFLQNVFDGYDLEEEETYTNGFESWLNDQGLNGNNGANEDKWEEYHEQHLESFIY